MRHVNMAIVLNGTEKVLYPLYPFSYPLLNKVAVYVSLRNSMAFNLGKKYNVFGKVATYRGEVAALFTFSVDGNPGEVLRVFPEDVETVTEVAEAKPKAKAGQ